MAALAPAQRRRRRLRRVGRRTRPATGLVRTRLRRQRVVGRQRDRAGGLGALHRHVPTADDDRRDAGPPGPPAHRRGRSVSSPTSGPSTRPGPSVEFAHGRRRHDGLGAGGLPARPRRTGLHPARHPGDEPLVVLHPARRAPDLRGLHVLRLPLPPDRRPGRSARPRTRSPPWHGTPTCRRSRQPRSPRTTACSTRCGGSRRARASTAARSSSWTPRPGRRASSPGTPPTSPRASCAPTATRT